MTYATATTWMLFCLNESPSEKEGKRILRSLTPRSLNRLNESPSEKEGKLGSFDC